MVMNMLDPTSETIKVAVIADCDYQEKPLGGVVSLLSNMLAADGIGKIEFYLIGISFDAADRQGIWQCKSIQGKKYRWLPVFVSKKPKEDTRIPLRFRLVAGIKRYWSEICLDGFEAVYIHSPEIALPLATVDVPIVCHVHGDPLIAATRSRFPLLRGNIFVKQYNKIVCRALDNSAGIIWAAKACRNEYYRRLEVSEVPRWDDKSTVIYSSVDTTMLQVVKSESASLVKNAKSMVTVSRLSDVKHIDFLIEVFAELYKERQDIDFYIAGEGECGQKLKEFAEELECVHSIHFLGNLNKTKLAALLREMDLFMFASESEAMSLVVLEGLAAGVPIITTRVGDIDEVVTEKTGAIIEGRNLSDFTGAVRNCLERGRDSYKEECMAVAQEFTAERMRLGIERFIEQCAR